MLEQTTTPPISISAEEHATLTSSTPSSFVDIPPVLRWADEVELVMSSLSEGWEAWASVLPQSQGQGGKVGGKLFVTEAAVTFLPHQTTPGFNLPFPSLTLHALTPASTDGPAHLYCQIDDSGSGTGPSAHGNGNANGMEVEVEGEQDQQRHNGDGQGNGNVNGDGDEDANGHLGGDDEDEEDDGEYAEDEEYTQMREVRIHLPDSKLEPLFQALSACSALHDSLLPSGEPSSFFGFSGSNDDDDDDGEDGQGQWEDAEEDMDGTADGGRIEQSTRFQPNTTPLTHFQLEGFITSPADLARPENQKQGGNNDNDNDNDDDEVQGVVDQMDRFLNLIDWGNIPKPQGWDDKV